MENTDTKFETMKFEGSGGEYFSIWIINILLSMLTLGIYLPWAKVRNRRYFYANTTLMGRNFEYHATGKQLLLGYLIAMVLFVAYVVFSKTMPIAYFIILGIFIFGYPWVINRSAKFSRKMTSFSNVRFDFDGSLGGAYANFLLLPTLFFIGAAGVFIFPYFVMPTLLENDGVPKTATGTLFFILFIGLSIFGTNIYAAIKKRKSAYIIDGTSYGNARFKTELDTKTIFYITLKAALMGVAIVVVTSIAVAVFTPKIAVAITNPDYKVVVGLVYYLVVLFLIAVVSSYFKARYRKHLFANTKLDEKISFASTLKARSLLWISVSNFLLRVFTFGLGSAWAKTRMTKLYVENTQVDVSYGLDEYLNKQQKSVSALGDQIGDAFEVDFDIGI